MVGRRDVMIESDNRTISSCLFDAEMVRTRFPLTPLFVFILHHSDSEVREFVMLGPSERDTKFL